MVLRRVMSLMLGMCVTFSLSLPNLSLAQEAEAFSLDINAAASRKKLRRACFGDECVRIRRSKFLGDFCWEYVFDEGTGPMKLGVFHMGGGHFLLSGKVRLDGEDGVIQGSAELIDEKLEILLQLVGRALGLEIPTSNPDSTKTVNLVGAAFFSGALDPETLDGEALFFEVDTFDEDTEGLETGLSYGGVLSLTSAECF